MSNKDLGRGFYQENPGKNPGDDPESITITVPSAGLGETDPSSGATIITIDDGEVIVDLNPTAPSVPLSEVGFNENLAEYADCSGIASRLLEAIEHDDQSRQDWLESRAAGIDMLGFKVETPNESSGGSASMKGMSTVRHPLLAEAVIRFQSNAAAELYPCDGPAKVRNDTSQAPPPPEGPPPGGDTITDDDLANALEKDFNHYLTSIDKGYRPDSVRMLFWVGFGGCGFKKVYNDPIRRMPISRSVDAADLIVSNLANDIDDAGRITHKITMRKSTLIRMQIAGVYRNIDIPTTPIFKPDAVDEAISDLQGQSSNSMRTEDNPYTIYECYCELNLPGFEHRDEDGNETGLELPYRVTIEKDSRQVLEIRRNWREDDENCMAKRVFVKFPFIPAMGFYDIGLLNLLGNSTKALTGAWRIMLDSGMFSSFPGFLYSKLASRQQTNEFRVPPGGGQLIETGGRPLSEVIMPLPYKDVSQGLMLLSKAIEEDGQRLGGTAELQVAEGRQDAPVGTTLAMIEQATKTLAAVHINLHVAQSEELQLLKECFLEDPESFWRFNKKPAHNWEVEEFIAALNNANLVPAADPNTPSHMHRILKAVSIKTLQMANPQLYDAKIVDARIMRMIGVTDPYSLFAPPQPPAPPASPPVDPNKMAELQLKQQDLKMQEAQQNIEQQQAAAEQQKEEEARIDQMQTESADRAADRASRERVANTREETERLKLLGQMAQSGAVPQQTAASAAIGNGIPGTSTLGTPPSPPITPPQPVQ